MRKIKSKDSKPELLVRRLVHSLGYRYRLHRRDLPGKPDLVFPKRRKVIFVHGCFWHQHPRSGCSDSRVPKTQTPYWSQKLARNKERDKQQIEVLQREGWQVLVVWECELKDRSLLSERIVRFLS